MATMHEQAALDKLSPELVSIVARQLDTPDLLALRQGGRDVCAKGDYAFLARCFRIRTHAYTRRGLQALVDITASPRLVKHVKELELVVVELNPAHYSDEGRFKDRETIPSSVPAFGGWDEEFTVKEPSIEERARQEQAQQEREQARASAWRMWLDEPVELHRDQLDQRLLTQALHNLSLADRQITLTIHDDKSIS